jgi:hypothetical protein
MKNHNLKIKWPRPRALSFSKTDTFMKANGQTTSAVAVECRSGKTDPYIKDIGKTTLLTVMVD